MRVFNVSDQCIAGGLSRSFCSKYLTAPAHSKSSITAVGARAAERELPMRAPLQVVRRVALFALAGLVLTTPAVGQTKLATGTGLVADSSGAAVPGVTVTATNQATNIAYTGTPSRRV